MMKRILYFFCIIFLTNSCEICQENKYVDSLTKKYRDFNFLLIIPAHKDSNIIDVCISNTIFYKNVFLLYYNSEYKSFSDFYCSVLNNKRRIEYNLIKDLPHQILDSEAEIFIKYKESGLNGLIGKYLKKESDHFYSVYLIGEDDKRGLIKIMFENQFYISWDDYGGRFVFTKNLKNTE